MSKEDLKKPLSEEEHNRIYNEIENEVFRNAKPSEKPIAIIVGGQSGSGKGAIISYSKKQMENKGKNCIIITSDEYKTYHPNCMALAKKFPTEYVKIVEQDAGPWTGKVLKKAIFDKYNFIFETTLKNDRILKRINELKQNGFKVVVRTIAVPKLESLLSIHERYQKQIDSIGFGRLITVEHHNEAYNGVPKTIEKIEKSGLCTVEIYKRGEIGDNPIQLPDPQLIYTSSSKSNKYFSARNALEECRRTEEKKTLQTAQQRLDDLKKAYKSRNASSEELNDLEKVEEYVFLSNDLTI